MTSLESALGTENSEGTFGEALEAMKMGASARRTGWKDASKSLSMWGSAEHVGEAYLELTTERASFPWSPTHTDLLEEDWVVS